MSLQKDLVGVGVIPEQALRLGYPGVTAITTAGTATGTATVLTESQRVAALTTAASQTGVRLPAAAELMNPYLLVNLTATTAVLYPHTGGAINGATADAGVNIAANKSAIAWRTASGTWLVNVGA